MKSDLPELSSLLNHRTIAILFDVWRTTCHWQKIHRARLEIASIRRSSRILVEWYKLVCAIHVSRDWEMKQANTHERGALVKILTGWFSYAVSCNRKAFLLHEYINHKRKYLCVKKWCSRRHRQDRFFRKIRRLKIIRESRLLGRHLFSWCQLHRLARARNWQYHRPYTPSISPGIATPVLLEESFVSRAPSNFFFRTKNGASLLSGLRRRN